MKLTGRAHAQNMNISVERSGLDTEQEEKRGEQEKGKAETYSKIQPT